RVWSPSKLPPVRRLDGSMARTAGRSPASITWAPSTSSKLLFPTPAGPVIPMRTTSRARSSRSARFTRSVATFRSSARRLSHRLMARASARRSPATTRGQSARARASTSSVGSASGASTRRAPRLLEQLAQPARDPADTRPRPVERCDPLRRALRSVLLPDDAPAHDEGRFLPRFFAELANELRHEPQVGPRQGRDADQVHVVVEGRPRDFLGRREQGPQIDVEARVGEPRRDQLRAAIVPVLP